jgi:hypothetical protein
MSLAVPMCIGAGLCGFVLGIDLKSAANKTAYGFDSRPWHQLNSASHVSGLAIWQQGAVVDLHSSRGRILFGAKSRHRVRAPIRAQ